MDQIIRIAMDTSKHVFQLHGVNAAEEPILRKKLRPQDMVTFFTRLPPTVIGIEVCGNSHHWARLVQSLGHQVKLIAPQLAKPYVKRGKSDAADANALCGAVSRPKTRLEDVESKLMAWHQADKCSGRLVQIPGVGPIGASMLVMKAPAPRYSDWPATLPAVGATTVIQQARRGRRSASPWLMALLKRKPPRLAAVALANKIARIAWKLMVSGNRYTAKALSPA
jgi:transposase